MSKSSMNFDFDQLPSFNLKEYLVRLLSYWKIFVLSIVVALAIAKFKNGYEERQYTMNTLVIIDEEKNPLFTGSTNIAFNWGGASNKVEAVKAKFSSRTHNETVVNHLDFFIDYLYEGDYRMVDSYGKFPFSLKINKNSFQLYGTLFVIKFVNATEFKIELLNKDQTGFGLMKYADQSTSYKNLKKEFFDQTYTIEEGVHNDVFDFDLKLKRSPIPNFNYIIRFNSFDGTVNRYRNLRVDDYKSGTSLLSITIAGPNKARLVDYLNTSVHLLDNELQTAKIAYAVRTKNYIDTLFRVEELKLKKIETQIQEFKKENGIYSLNTEAGTIFAKLNDLDNKIYNLNARLKYYQNLKQYLAGTAGTNSDVIAPSLIDIEDPNITMSTAKLIELSQQKAILQASVTDEHPAVIQVKKEIQREKDILEEHIDEMILNISRTLYDTEELLVEAKGKSGELPVKEQELINFQRTRAMNEGTYSYLKQKSYEAGSAIASNVSELKVIDSAKDIGQGFTYPRISFNYMVALLLGIVIPLLLVITVDLLNDKIETIEELKNKFKIPVLGTVGTIKGMEKLIVFKKSKSSIAESFRILRSNIYFLYKNKDQDKTKSKTILVTSSISGEGKTTIAVNLATVLALGGKKTLLMNMDLRKPRMHKEFDMENKKGIVNVLIGSEKVENVIEPSDIPNLDVLLSGPIPPNPSELIMGSQTEQMLKAVQKKYDRIIIDSSPIGLVSDTLELLKYSDANLYVVREGYTRRGMLKMIEEKYAEGEITNISYVLNFYNAKGKYGYGYDYGKYGYGYVEDNEVSFFRKIFKK